MDDKDSVFDDSREREPLEDLGEDPHGGHVVLVLHLALKAVDDVHSFGLVVPAGHVEAIWKSQLKGKQSEHDLE
jgi:hypothetical protein